MNRKNDAKKWSILSRADGLWFFVLILGGLLAVLFWRSFDPSRVLFANDGPLGALVSARAQLPAAFAGSWADLNSYGARDLGAPPNLTCGILWLFGPFGFAKFYAPLSLLILGIGTWFFIRQMGLGAPASVLGGLAAALSSGFFGVSCWGLGSQSICFGLDYFAMGIVVSPKFIPPWVRYPLAGFLVGMAVMEAADIGAIFSIVTGVFVVAHAFISNGGMRTGVVQGGVRVAVIAVCAGFIATAALLTLIGTQVAGVVGMEQDAKTKAARWDQATQWSFPKREVLGIVVPGIFGFRMDTPDGGSYWGAIGRDPAWDRYFDSGKQDPPPDPRNFIRYGGGGGYAGVLVVIIALWAVLRSLGRECPEFSIAQRRFIWFWTGVALVALLLSFGRHAPFFQFIYGLPYVSTMRNPTKFLHIWQWALVVIFAYGVYGLTRRFQPTAPARDLVPQLQSWWAKAAGFDRKWTVGSFVAVAASLIGWLIYSSSKGKLVAYLQEVQFDETTANAIAAFSLRQTGWFIVIFAIALGFFTIALSGYFSGRRVRMGLLLLGFLVVADLAWVDLRWVVSYNWKIKYEANPIIEKLRERPYEHRVAIFPLDRFVDVRRLPREMMPLVQQYSFFAQIYGIEWTQHLFQFYNIQSLDIIQEPRVAQDKAAYEAVLAFAPLRRWELSNTRYLLGPSAFVESLNQQLDSGKGRFRIATQFDLAAKPGVDQSVSQSEQVTTVIHTNGQLAVIDFAGALPRAKLYSDWRVSTNDPSVLQEWVRAIQPRVPHDMGSALAAQSPTDLATLHELADNSFDPAQTVLLAEPLTVAPTTNQSAGEVKYESYAPKRIVLKATANTPAVLLLNDRFDPNWKVTVDGQPAKLLRCNFIMRGVFLDKAGEHLVEFKFEPPMKGLYVSLVAIAVALGLLGYVGFAKRGD